MSSTNSSHSTDVSSSTKSSAALTTDPLNVVTPSPNLSAPVSTGLTLTAEEKNGTPPSQETGRKRCEVCSDDDDEIEETGKRGRGKPSHFTGARLVAMEKGFMRYTELKTRKEKIQFWPSFMAEIMEEFPLSKYPIPASCLASRDKFEEKTPEQIKALKPKAREAYYRSLRLASSTEEQLYLQMVKDWILWWQNTARKAEGGTTGKLFKAELEKKKKKVKPQFNHFVMKHSDYKDQVVCLSVETGRLDRLPKRAEAMKDLLEKISPEEVDQLRTEYSEVIDALDEGDNDKDAPADVAAQRSHHKDFGSLAQDVLNIWRRLTGLNLVLWAGECIDGQADYDSCVIFSKPDGCPDMDAGEGVDFDRFSNTFLHWLKEIYTKTHPNEPVKQPMPSATNSTPALASSATVTCTRSTNQGMTSERRNGSEGRDNERARSNRGKKASKRAGSTSSEEDTPEPSEPSDIGSDSEDEDNREGVSERPAKSRAPVNCEGLWEKDEEGLPVLKVPMCDLTREQQAAFTRECAMAIGLTKALDDLNTEISQSGKGKKSSVSRYKGMKATHKSSRILAVPNDQERSEGSMGDNEEVGDEQGKEVNDVEMDNGVESGTEHINNHADNADDTMKHIIRCVDSMEDLPAWAKAMVMGYNNLDVPRMEAWAQFDIQGCSTPFLKEYAGWLLGLNGTQRPEAWTTLVYRWIEVEEAWNQRNVSVLGPQIKMLKNRRPHGFLQWFKYGCLRWEALVPSEVCVDTLGHEWWVWWSKVVNP
ncbi:hypothetical protein VNI00_016512 [Paramarasmius palmivorus]|uniref:Uncharacterized protein n=1 Tax=Paramarasmius palmivorus TaxID=297713 RepID=A0AAW0BGM7_9AGAR